MLRHLIAILSLSIASLSAATLQPPERIEVFARGPGAHQPIPRYQGGYVFSRDASLSVMWVDSATSGSVLEQPLVLPERFRVLMSDVAVSFDGEIAVAASAMDREGEFASVIAWLTPDGSVKRVVRTSPFGVRDIAFTGDGSLWALGILKKNLKEEEPVHDILRQYDRDGKLVRTVLPRLSLSSGWRHPGDGSFVTSRERVAFVSSVAKKWVVMSTDGTVLAQGPLLLPPGFAEHFLGAVTDSGRLFVSGPWEGDEKPDANYPLLPLFEVDQTSGKLEMIDTSAVFPEGMKGLLLGSDGEKLVYLVYSVGPEADGSDARLTWSEVR